MTRRATDKDTLERTCIIKRYPGTPARARRDRRLLLLGLMKYFMMITAGAGYPKLLLLMEV